MSRAIVAACSERWSSTSTSRWPGPGPTSAPRGTGASGERYGLDLDPARYDDARRAAFETLERHPELEHDEEIWVLFTQRIIEGMGGGGDTYACAAEMTHAWEHADHFELYDDALPALAALRARGLKLGLLSNTARDLDAFVAHHALDVDAVLTSRVHGKTKPHEAIFRRMLELLGVDAGRGGDGRRHARGRHRGRARGRHARVAGRPRAAAIRTTTDAARPTCAGCPPRSASTRKLALVGWLIWVLACGRCWRSVRC